MPWQQVYNPLNNTLLTTLAAIAPVVILLGCLAIFHVKAHYAALLGLIAALLVAILVFGMPIPQAAAATVYGAAYGLLPIGWIILNVIFLYQLANRKGAFGVLQENLMAITQDRRLQLLLVSFCFGTFFEGAAGFGYTGRHYGIHVGALGFGPRKHLVFRCRQYRACSVWRVGHPYSGIAGRYGFDLRTLSSVIAWQLLLFDVIIPLLVDLGFAVGSGRLKFGRHYW